MKSKGFSYVTVVILAAFSFFAWYGTFERADNVLRDTFLREEREPIYENPPILIVGMDEYSVERYGQWPWARSHTAELIDALTDMGAAAIGVDVLYDTYGQIPENDILLIEAAARSGNVVFASSPVYDFFDDSYRTADERGYLTTEELILPFPELLAVSETGHISLIPNHKDGVIRHGVSQIGITDGGTLNAFAIEVYNTYLRSRGEPSFDASQIPTDAFSRFNINYVDAPHTFPMLSFASVIEGDYPPEVFDNAIVLVGPYAIGIGSDLYHMPFDRQEKMFGIEIHANILQNLIENDFKQDAPPYASLAFVLTFAALALLAFKYVPQRLALLAAVVLMAVSVFAGKAAFGYGYVLRLFYPVVLVFVLYITHLAVSFAKSQLEKRRVTDLFGRFVAPEIVAELIASGEDVSLGGALREVTVMFVDVRGFTTFSEVTPPETVVAILNNYLKLTTNAILNNKGTLDKFIGDATMAVFNAPNTLLDHCFHAVCAAVEMQKNAAELREKIQEEYGVNLQFGIGINTGMAIVGNIGSPFRMDYTVIGDTVNTAARLESNAKPGMVLISQAVYDVVADRVNVESLGNISVKGKKTELTVYSVLGVK